MGFFFSENKVSSVKSTIYQFGCKACPLDRQYGLKNPKIRPTGVEDPVFYVLGEYPGAVEDSTGEQFRGKHGQLLRKVIFSIFGKDIVDSSFRWNTCVRCRPIEKEGGRLPTDVEIECCRKSIEDDIEKTKPLFILGFGGIPLKWLKRTSGITMWRGRITPVKVGNHECWYFPMLTPSFLTKENRDGEQEEDRNMRLLFEADLKMAYNFSMQTNVPLPNGIYDDYSANIEYVLGRKTSDIYLIKEQLKYLAALSYKAIDIETLGLRPYGESAKLLSVAIGTYDKIFAFPIDHPRSVLNPNEVMQLLGEFLYEDKGVKIAHNAIFEMIWLSYLYGKDVLYKSKWADTQAQAYTLDERTKKQVRMLNLNTQCLLHFDFALKTLSSFDPENPLKMTMEDLLIYNGMDSKYEYRLFERQDKQVRSVSKLSGFYDHLMETAITLVQTHFKGLDVDFDKIRELDTFLTDELVLLERRIKENKDVKSIYNFNVNSPFHLTALFKDVLKIPCYKKTDSGGYSTDHEVLEHLAEEGIEIAEDIMSYRELSKIHGTYVKDIGKYLYNNRMYPWYNHLLTSTARFSSDSPNLQNYPKRKYKHVRCMIKAPEDHWIVSLDMGQIEARVIAMASKDKVFCEALHKGYDVHMEWARRVIEFYPKVIGVESLEEATAKQLKDFRGIIKNKLVFPWFYLASPYSVGNSLGIPNNVIRDVYDDFWDMFKGIRKWQDTVLEFYKEYGYVESLIGNRRHGPLSMNMIVNSPIQSTAGLMVANAGNRLSRFAYETDQERFQFNLNIHDDLTFILPDKTLEDDIEFIAKEMCNIPYHFVNVPITVEASIGNNWGDLVEVKAFDSRDFGFTYGERRAA